MLKLLKNTSKNVLNDVLKELFKVVIVFEFLNDMLKNLL